MLSDIPPRGVSADPAGAGSGSGVGAADVRHAM
jgi:hypothetical protein